MKTICLLLAVVVAVSARPGMGRRGPPPELMMMKKAMMMMELGTACSWQLYGDDAQIQRDESVCGSDATCTDVPAKFQDKRLMTTGRVLAICMPNTCTADSECTDDGSQCMGKEDLKESKMEAMELVKDCFPEKARFMAKAKMGGKPKLPGGVTLVRPEGAPANPFADGTKRCINMARIQEHGFNKLISKTCQVDSNGQAAIEAGRACPTFQFTNGTTKTIPCTSDAACTINGYGLHFCQKPQMPERPGRGLPRIPSADQIIQRFPIFAELEDDLEDLLEDAQELLEAQAE